MRMVWALIELDLWDCVPRLFSAPFSMILLSWYGFSCIMKCRFNEKFPLWSFWKTCIYKTGSLHEMQSTPIPVPKCSVTRGAYPSLVLFVPFFLFWMTQYCSKEILEKLFRLLINSWLNKKLSWLVANNESWSQVRYFVNDFHEWCSHRWKLSVDHLTSRIIKCRYLLQFVSSFYFLCPLTRSNISKHMGMDKNSHRSFGSPLFLDQSIVVLWRHENVYCEVIWPIVLRWL